MYFFIRDLFLRDDPDLIGFCYLDVPAPPEPEPPEPDAAPPAPPPPDPVAGADPVPRLLESVRVESGIVDGEGADELSFIPGLTDVESASRSDEVPALSQEAIQKAIAATRMIDFMILILSVRKKFKWYGANILPLPNGNLRGLLKVWRKKYNQ